MYRRGTRDVVLLLLSLAALALAVTGRYDWRWSPPIEQYERPYGDVKLTNQNGSRAADMWSQSSNDWYNRIAFEDGYDHSI
jgi:hypothetical protein